MIDLSSDMFINEHALDLVDTKDGARVNASPHPP